MSQIVEAAKFYLSNKSNHALMINGNWGKGKTYFVKNILFPEIEKLPVLQNHNKKYKPIIISLYGLKSIEQVQSEIFLSIYPFFDKSSVKLASSTIKALIKGVLYLNKLGDQSELLNQFDKTKKDLINLNEIVICFDDFERASPDLKTVEIIGYINSLVENDEVKIIIIANQDKIENFVDLREKTISNVIEFEYPIEDVYDNIIKINYESYKWFSRFLVDYKHNILELFKNNSDNIRILIQTLNYLQNTISSLEANLKKNDILRDYQSEIFLTILKFTIGISIEYSAGKISLNKREDLDSNAIFMSLYNSINLFNKQNKETPDSEKSYAQKFREKYYTSYEYFFFESIYKQITGGTSIEIDILILELRKCLNITNNNIEAHYEVFNQLNYPNVFNLSNTDYKSYTRKMLEYSD